MNDYSQGYSYTGGSNRERPAPGDPEAPFYGQAGERGRWVDADGRPDARAGYMPYGYSRYTRTVSRRRGGWGKWLLIALAILLAIPLLKVLLAVVIVASVAIALLLGFVVFLALVVVGGALLFGAGHAMTGRRHTRL